MMHRIVIIITTLIFLAGTCMAQNSKYKWGLGIHPSSFSFYAGFDSSFIDLGEYENGVQFSINRYMGKLLDVGVEGSAAILRHPAGEDNPDTGGLWRDFFYDANPFIKIKAYNGFLLKEKSFVMPFLKAGIGINKYRTADLGISAPLGAGIGFRFKDAGYLVVQSSYNLGVSNSSNYLHHSLGFVVNLKGRNYKKKSALDQADKDKDGIPDFSDECPEIAAKNSKTGCPDMDGDGVKDSDDLCPRKKGLINLRGCLDQDKDGIPDPMDKCPNKFGAQANKGCPDTPSDKDNDLIEDELDDCPTLPGHWSGKGCPDQDGDGILDDEDQCPTLFGENKYGGCPFDEQGMKDLNDGYAPNGVAIYVEERTTTVTQTIPTTTKPAKPKVKLGPEVVKPIRKPVITQPEKKAPPVVTTPPVIPSGSTTPPVIATQPEPTTPPVVTQPEPTTPPVVTQPEPTTPPVVTQPEPTMPPVVAQPEPTTPTVVTPPATPSSDALPCNLPKNLLTSAGQSIRFETNKATLTPDSKLLLMKVATLLKPCAAMLSIRAHTDSDGDEEYNLRLSERRAQAVSRYLIEHGLDRKYIQTSGAGNAEPLSTTGTIEGNAMNRRVEFTLTPR